jgi:Uma2 family endonuclease
MAVMSTITPVTAEQLLRMPYDGFRYELVGGELRKMSPAGWKHGDIAQTISVLLGPYIRQHGLGKCFATDTGFLIERDPDTVRAPDFAFIAKENLPPEDPPDAFWPGAPDLAVEVLSPGDTTGEVDEKIEMWLAAGVKAVWIVDPQLKTVTIHRSAIDIETRTVNDQLDGGDVVPGFSCQVAEVFE